MTWILGGLLAIALLLTTRLRRPAWPPRPSDLSEQWRRAHLYEHGKQGS
jgi:hypothetical protein